MSSYSHVLPRCSLDDANDPSVKWLENLESSFVWEARSLYFVAVAVPLYWIYQPAASVVTGVAAVVVIVMVRACLFHFALSFDAPVGFIFVEGNGLEHLSHFSLHLYISLLRRTPSFR
jgi:hypothetical protein